MHEPSSKHSFQNSRWRGRFFFFLFLGVFYATGEVWRYGKVEINYVVGFSFSYMDFISLIFQRQIMKTLLSYIGFEEFFLLIRIITTINFIIVVIENLVRWVIKKNLKIKLNELRVKNIKIEITFFWNFLGSLPPSSFKIYREKFSKIALIEQSTRKVSQYRVPNISRFLINPAFPSQKAAEKERKKGTVASR